MSAPPEPGLPNQHLLSLLAALPHAVSTDITGEGEPPLRKLISTIGQTTLLRSPSPHYSPAGAPAELPEVGRQPWKKGLHCPWCLGLGIAKAFLSSLAPTALSQSEIWQDLEANAVLADKQSNKQTSFHQSSLKALPMSCLGNAYFLAAKSKLLLGSSSQALDSFPNVGEVPLKDLYFFIKVGRLFSQPL